MNGGGQIGKSSRLKVADECDLNCVNFAAFIVSNREEDGVVHRPVSLRFRDAVLLYRLARL